MSDVSMRTWLIRGSVGLIVALGLYFAFRSDPVAVDLARVERGPMDVTIDDDGEARVREVYVVSAPLPGRVLRFEGRVGDPVRAGESVVAEMMPANSVFLDARTRSQLEAALDAAEAAQVLAAAELGRVEAEADFARTELRRAEELGAQGAISAADLDRARKEARAADAALETARAALDVREHERETARAALLPPGDPDATGRTVGDRLPVRAPVNGTILRIFQESEGVVPAGTPLVEIGDPSDLEIVVDLLSLDAVRVHEGDRVLLERWGGSRPLAGVVRRIEPFAVTKVSALGIEEQRVNVIVDLTDPVELWKRLGHGYRVEARIVLWHRDDVAQVPVSALFRHADGWAVFAAVGGRARLTEVEIGRTNGRMAEVLAGLETGDEVVLYPSARVGDGSPLVRRPSFGEEGS